MEVIREIMGGDYIPVYTEKKFGTRARTFIKILLRPYNFLTLGLAVFMLVWLFIIPHGLADNGDFFRIIHNRGLSHISAGDADNYFNYFTKDYHLTNWFVGDKVSFVSTHSIIIQLSIWVNRLINPGTIYDVRVIGVFYALVFLFATRIILKAIYEHGNKLFSRFGSRTGRNAKWALMLLYVFVFGDFAYLLYFNSFFGEALSFTMLLLLTAALIKILQDKVPKLSWLIVFAAAGIMLTGAKQQNPPLGLLLAIFSLRFLTLSKKNLWRAASIASAVAITLTAVITYAAISDEIEYINEYHSITMGVARYADKPERFAELGVDPQMEILKDTIVYDRYPVALLSSPFMHKRLYSIISPLKIGVYYLRHPGLFMNQLKSVASSGFAIRAQMVGNFLKTQGKPPLTQSYAFSGYSFIKPYVIPRSAGFLISFYVALLLGWAYLYYIFVKRANMAGRLMVEFSAMIGVMAIIQAAVAVLGAGDADIGKHLFLFNVNFDFLLWFLISGIMFSVKIIMTRGKGMPARENLEPNIEGQAALSLPEEL